MTKLVQHNLGIKLLAIILAIAAWGFTRVADPVEEWQLILELDVRTSVGQSLVSRDPGDLSITAYVTGQISRLERLSTTRPKVVLDGRGLQPGVPEMVELRIDRRFPGVSIELEPPKIELTIDETNRKNFVPEEITEGLLPTGYYIDSRSGLPESIAVLGAKSLVELVDRVVYYLNLSALTGSTELSFEFKPIDESGVEIQNLSLTPAIADIGIGLQPSQALKAVPIVVDYQGNPAVNYALTSLSSDPFLVEVAGPAEALSDILSIRTAPLNLTGKTSSFQQSVTLISPSENVSLSVTQANVSVEIEQIESRYTFNDVLIELRGTSPDFSYILNPERVNVTIRGGLGGISGASTDEIRPRVDLDRLGAGTHNIRVTVALPSGVRLDSVEPSLIEITITQQTPETPEPPPGDEPGDSTEPSEQPDETNGSE
ncbi:hypothetical protein KAU08_07380 [bacterium]|nr:hypothetical protein [bacterium]